MNHRDATNTERRSRDQSGARPSRSQRQHQSQGAWVFLRLCRCGAAAGGDARAPKFSRSARILQSCSTEQWSSNPRSAAVSAEDQPQRPRIPAGTRWNPRHPTRSTCCGWCSAHTAALRESSPCAPQISSLHGRPARPASNPSLPITLPQIPLPNSPASTGCEQARPPAPPCGRCLNPRNAYPPPTLRSL